MEQKKAKILVIEDERSMREILKMLLEGEGYGVVTATDGLNGLAWIEKDIFDIVITDIKMPGADGFGILKRTLDVSPETLVIMITAFGTMEAAVEAMKMGAYDYVHKPFKIDEIRLIVKNALDKRRLKTEVAVLREQVKSAYEVENIIAKSPAMRKIVEVLPKIANGTSNVLITGESGTGKEVMANAIHNLSSRRDKNMVAINCASFPEGLLESELFGHMRGSFTGAVHNKQGLFEVADKGTLFLDEVTEMPVSLQSKLLRAIENGSFRRVGGTNDIKVDVRIVSATNRDPKEAVSQGLLREDLFYRLNAMPIHIPPLRERREDIPLFVDHFMGKYSDKRAKVSGEAMQAFMDYPWNGNVRELENLIERMVLLSDDGEITEKNLPPEITKEAGAAQEAMPRLDEGVNLENIIQGVEKRYLLEALERAGGKKTEAARLLNISFRSFRHRLSKYGIK